MLRTRLKPSVREPYVEVLWQGKEERRIQTMDSIAKGLYIFFAHKYCNSIKLKSSVCTRKASAKQITTTRVQVSSMSIGGLCWFGNIRGLPSPTLYKFNFSEPNNHQMSSVEESKKVDHSRPDCV